MKDINIRSVLLINGVMLCSLSAVMVIPLLFDIFFCFGKCIDLFATSIFLCAFFGVSTILSCKTSEKASFSRRDTFLLVALLWIIAPIASSLPFYFYDGVKLSFASSLFESSSGITVTGATIYPDVEILPRALNLWRFILHFIGGVGIVAIGIVALPLMRIGGMQLFLTEYSDKSQKFLPRASQIVGFFVGSYILIIGFFSILLRLNGMCMFDAICHSITAIATGGFSTKNTGISWFESSKIELVMSAAMFVGGMAFLEIVRCFKNGFESFYKNQQTIGYIRLVLIVILVPIILAFIFGQSDVSLKRISSYIFQALSAITTTGLEYSANSFMNPQVLFLLLGMVGGCSGSTSGGVKVFRIQILYAILKHHINQLSRPFSVDFPKHQGHKISDNISSSVVSFFVFLAITISVSAMLLCIITGKNSSDCFHSVVSCIFNIGYDVGFSSFQSCAKLILIIDMIVGRLEIIPMFIIFSRAFWRN